MSAHPHRLGATFAGLILLGACLAERGSERCGCGPESAALPVVPPYETISFPSPRAEAEAPSPAGSEGATASLPDFSDPSWTQAESRAGTYLVCWRAPEGEVSRNKDFTLEVWILRGGVPVRDAFLSVHAWMPAHGHGMLRKSRAERQPDGSFLVDGMLLHMRGHWQVFFEVLEGTLSETTQCDLDL